LETILNNIRSLQPVLLILDVYIPGVSGLKVLQGLQKPGGSTEPPVLLCSAAHNEIVVMEQQLQQAGLVVPPVLEKPFDLDDFVSLINRLVGEPEV
jgi:CheY-like chemotaxis protein